MNNIQLGIVAKEYGPLIDWFCSRDSITLHDLQYAATSVWLRFRIPGSYLVDYLMRERDKKFVIRGDVLSAVPRGSDAQHEVPDYLRDLPFSREQNMVEENQWFAPLFTLGIGWQSWSEVLIKNTVWSEHKDTSYPVLLYYGNRRNYLNAHKVDQGLLTFPVMYERDGEVAFGVKHTSAYLFDVLMKTLGRDAATVNLYPGENPETIPGLRRDSFSGSWVLDNSPNLNFENWEHKAECFYSEFESYMDELENQISHVPAPALNSLMYLIVSQKMEREALMRSLYVR